jgi:hypothetical protein
MSSVVNVSNWFVVDSVIADTTVNVPVPALTTVFWLFVLMLADSTTPPAACTTMPLLKDDAPELNTTSFCVDPDEDPDV